MSSGMGVSNPDAALTSEQVEAQIAAYEQRFDITSDEFLRRYADGTIPDSFDAMEWFVLLKHRVSAE